MTGGLWWSGHSFPSVCRWKRDHVSFGLLWGTQEGWHQIAEHIPGKGSAHSPEEVHPFFCKAQQYDGYGKVHSFMFIPAF